jgi:hypothetical protein
MQPIRFPPRARLHRAACRLAVAALHAATLAACRDMPRASMALAAETPGGLDGHLRWLGDIRLEENDTVVNVLARMNLDRRGGFLVADEQENQIRAYAPDGRLLRHFGRKGSGPKEFVFLHGAMRLETGQVLGVDYQGKGVVFDSTGATALHTFIAPVAPVQYVRLVNDTLVLLGGRATPRRGRRTDARLHLWNLARDTVVRSFFAPPIVGRAHTLAANVGGFVGADVRHDTVAAVFALTDTIYFFRLDGRKLGQIPIPFQHFRPLSERGPLPGQDAGVVQAHEWAGSFSLVSDVFWLRDGGFLVQYQDRVGSAPHWRLLRMRRDGTRVFDAFDTPMLLAVDPRDDTLYFTKPGSLTADVWSRATLAAR